MAHSLIDYSLGRSVRITHSLGEASTSGFISDDAPHWSIEPFIPMNTGSLLEYLISRDELTPEQVSSFRRFADHVDKILQDRTALYHTRFSAVYAAVDPDSDSRVAITERPAENAVDASVETDQPPPADTSETATTVASDVLSLCEEILEQAGYRRLTREDIEACVGVASQWGVPLYVDLDLFAELVVYARGDIIGTRFRRRVRTLYRRESVTVPIFQRMAVFFRLCDDDDSEENLTADGIHLRLFKNVPKQDIDTLLPGSRVRISGIDHAKIIVPSLGGFLMSLRKIAQYALLFAVFALHWTAILVVLLVGYMIKSVMSYFQTKNRYQLNLTRNLYFQKLDANAGVGYHIIQHAHRQSSLEMLLAYYAILVSSEPISTRRLRRRCERIVREAINVEVEFMADRTLQRLLQMNAVQRVDDHWACATLPPTR